MANPDLTTYGSGKYTGLMMAHAGALNAAVATVKGYKQVSTLKLTGRPKKRVVPYGIATVKLTGRPKKRVVPYGIATVKLTGRPKKRGRPLRHSHG